MDAGTVHEGVDAVAMGPCGSHPLVDALRHREVGLVMVVARLFIKVLRRWRDVGAEDSIPRAK